MHARLWVFFVLLVVVAGCDSGSKPAHPGVTGPAVAWTSTRPSQLAERPAASRFCHASGLALRGQVKFVLRLQGGYAVIPVRNAGKQPCRLTGRPLVRLVKQGGPRQVQQPIAPAPSTFPEVTYPPPSLLALRPGESAAVTVSWTNWCDLKVPGKPHVPPKALRITLPAGRGHLDADYNAVPPCLDPKRSSVIGVSDFQTTPIPRGKPWSAALLTATVPDRPLHARRGGVLHYRVVLKNRSSTTVRFGRCPVYVEQLVPAGKIEAYLLNCGGAHAIAPGKSLAFAMEVAVPRKSLLGPNGLFWALDPFGAAAPQLNVRVVVGR
ncbi:MAG: DUF4232 domain-containing protein [Gaiellaceae bacterium]